ncbi:hypothetical protein AVEN_155147-1 [Araneus ventricosus]|uniref:Retrovirus-related Pol polyprotein from transposon TNT 1-94 n=1 Tax=Araneus ventricosus TaxID=182803 RepID=A0A4Y2WZW3_ARAVE|nr:hypothetical protein AVEN_155147-1 [Araneus ventricosus]
MNDKIAPLTSDNYPSWKQDMIAILLDRNVYDIVLGKENPPGDDATEKEKMRFKKRCNKAFSSIYLNVSKDLRHLIADITEGKKAWEVIQKYFHAESTARTIGLLDQFFSCRIEINEKIGLYAARLRKIIVDLLDCGEKVPLKYQAFQLIRFLPDCFGAIVQAIYRWPDDRFTFDQVLNELIAEEARLEQCSRDHERFALHSATPLRTGTRNFSKINHPQDKAKQNNKTGYSDGNYWVKKKGSQKSFIAEACITERSDPNAWIIDSAATTHFCSDRKWFTKFEPSNKPKHIYLANSDTCPIEGKGTAKLSYPNGQCFFFNNVIYSSQIRHNLISAPKLDQGGAKFIGQRRKIQVFHGKERLFTATLCSGLYKTYPKPPQTTKVTSFNISKTEDRENRSVHSDFKKTPFELYGGFKPSVTQLKPFGIEAFVGIPKQRSKLQMKPKRGVMVGYALQTKGYRIYLPEERRIIETINVSFGNKIYKEINDRSGIELDPKTGTFNYTSPQTTEESVYE